MSLEMWTLAVAFVTAVCCALCGVLLVVKREALVSEGLSHAVLPGIVVAYVLLRDRSSPLLLVGAALTGLLMILAVQALSRTRLIPDDASLGIVFSAMFSIGIILANTELRNSNFHAHCIIDGNLALTPLNTWELGGISLGPKAFSWMLAALALVATFIIVFYKELKIMSFDSPLARSFGFRPTLMHTLWLGIVSLVTVAAFESAGSILVVALMIAPPASAFLLTRNLQVMFAISAAIACMSTLIGFYLGIYLDISPTGPMASISGVFFLAALMMAPKGGLLAQRRLRQRHRYSLLERLLLLRLSKSVTAPLATRDHLREVLDLNSQELDAACTRLAQARFIEEKGEQISLTSLGRDHLQSS